MAKSEFIAQADEICQSIKDESGPLEKRFQQLSESAKSASEFKQVADMLRELVGYSAKGVSQIQDLEAPAADQSTIDSYVAAVNSRISTGKEFADALETGNQGLVTSLSKQGSAISSKVSAMAKSYGFKVCGSPK